MGSGRIVIDDLNELSNLLSGYEDATIGIWGVVKGIHPGNEVVYHRVRALSDVVVGFHYQNWGSLIKGFTGCGGYNDGHWDEGLQAKMSTMNDITYVMSEDIFSGQYGYTKQDLWDQILQELPTKTLYYPFRSDKWVKDILTSHLRTAQAMLTVVNGVIDMPYQVRAGCLRDGFRWDLINWYNKKWYNHTYHAVEPMLDKYGNTLSSTRDNVKAPIILPGDNKNSIWHRTGLNCLYLFEHMGFKYAGFLNDDATYSIEGVRI